MEKENIPIYEQELLYDPMFADDPEKIIKDDPIKGLLGKVALKKAAFIVVLIFFISLSMYFSFRTVSKDVYTYKENGTFENGETAYMLSEYHGDSKTTLVLDFVRDENDVPDETKRVREVGRYAVNCNESLSFIYISDDVTVIDPKAFYTCKNLKAFFVDENNPSYTAIDGILYRTENGVPVEIMMCPPKNGEYHASLKLGALFPDTPDKAEIYLKVYNKLSKESPSEETKKTRLQTEAEENFSTITLPDTVTVINELCFAECYGLRHIVFNDKITDIETLAFFKCKNLQELSIPDSVTFIGSDAFSSCESIPDIFIPESVKTIGHHAFYGCSGVEKVRMACSEEEAKEMDLGSAWLPEKRKVVMRPIGVSYNEEREVK